MNMPPHFNCETSVGEVWVVLALSGAHTGNQDEKLKEKGC